MPLEAVFHRLSWHKLLIRANLFGWNLLSKFKTSIFILILHNARVESLLINLLIRKNGKNALCNPFPRLGS